jgi:hypothetical protein
MRCPEEVWFGCVYRQRNLDRVERLLAAVDECGGQAHLWALDVEADSLAHLTRGTGPGGKFELLAKLLDTHPPPPESWVVLSDDDYRFRRGTLRDLLAIACAASLDLVQPAHRRFVNASHHLTLVRPRVTARRTHFVEIGPVVAMSPEGRTLLLPLPAAHMGWGVEAVWSSISLSGEINLGIVDAVTIEHLDAVGRDYDALAAERERDMFIDGIGAAAIREGRRNIGYWRRRDAEAPWPHRGRTTSPSEWL